jgi:hypothetical protein
MNGLKIAIIGTRGIPNYYGGFEQFAEYLSVDFVERGHQITVYNSHQHPFQEKIYKGVLIKHCFDPEYLIGTAGQFIYDLNCIRDIRKKNFDIVLQLGYTSSSIWSKLLPKKSIIVTNMDGLEWKRTKYSKWVQKFLLYAEKLAIRHSDYLISDSLGIQEYVKQKYKQDSVYIPYGADIFTLPEPKYLNKFNLKSYGYNMLIARLEPENSVEIILEGVVNSGSLMPFLVIGNHKSKYGQYLKEKYKLSNSIIFMGGIYDIIELNNLRYFSNIYFHGHTVGGTNPSLLEAMSSSCLICAHNNIFNRSILGNDAFYFESAAEIVQIISQTDKQLYLSFLTANLLKIKDKYSWKFILNEYFQLFNKLTLKGGGNNV